MTVIIVIVCSVVGYVFFTLKSGDTLNEISPLAETSTTSTPQEKAPQKIKDSLDSMNETTKAQFLKEVALMKNQVMKKAETMPQKAEIVSSGDFVPRAHAVEGNALLIKEGDQDIVRFENFLTDNGPRLHIYLSADLGADDFIDLGKIRATKGNVNYTVPANTDLKKYHYVLVWCKPFGVLFSYAELL